jgi:very-short-patch-repair endonuclease
MLKDPDPLPTPTLLGQFASGNRKDLAPEAGLLPIGRSRRPLPGMDVPALERLARAHHGAVDRRLARCSSAAWSRAHASGLLVALYPNVSRLAGTFETPRLRIAAAVLATGPDALASHRSAALLWGIPRPADDPVDVILPQRGPQRRLAGVFVHRPRDQLRLRPPQRRDGIACTNVVRVLCDLGAVDPGAVRGAVGHVLSTRSATLAALQSAVLDHAERGRHGIVALRNALEAWEIDGRPADSVLEAAMARLVRRHGLPPVEFHPIVEGWEADFRVIGTNVLIECDGWTHHGLDREQFERDRRRDAQLAAAGWITLRFTYRAIVQTPSATAGRIRDAVARWAA